MIAPENSPNEALALTPVPIYGGEILGRPRGMTDEECGGLSVRITPVIVGPHDQLSHQYLSRWTLDPVLRQLIADGADILLSNIGGQPATMLYVSNPDEPEA